jgi:hypothetical protein
MQEPSDPLNTQSSSGEEAQTDEPVVSRQETPGELRNGGAENDATDNAPTVSEQEVQSHLPNETASMSKSADEPAANFAQDETPLETVCTPLVELTRPESDGPINIATIHREGSPAQVALKHRDRIPAMPPSLSTSRWSCHPNPKLSDQHGSSSIASSLCCRSTPSFPRRNARFLRIGRLPRGSWTIYHSFPHW